MHFATSIFTLVTSRCAVDAQSKATAYISKHLYFMGREGVQGRVHRSPRSPPGVQVIRLASATVALGAQRYRQIGSSDGAPAKRKSSRRQAVYVRASDR